MARQAAEHTGKKAVYDDLYGIPENMIGEILDGELIVTPRPSFRHSHAASSLGGEILPPYRFGRGGPGGWIVLDEPEIMLGEHLLVPDLAGWRKENFKAPERENWIAVSPDWVCEVLSPRTLRTDKIRKMPIYAEYGVSHLWLIDPSGRTLDVFRLESGRWALLASFLENDKIGAAPFDAVEIDLGTLWWEEG